VRALIAAGLCLAALAIGVAAAPAETPEMTASAQTVYAQVCAACHGLTGEGNGPVAFAIKPPPRNFVKDTFKAGDSVDQIFATITNGLPDTRMVGYPQVPEATRWGLAYHVRSFRKHETPH
jgi:high-affinity iron transporter